MEWNDITTRIAITAYKMREILPDSPISQSFKHVYPHMDDNNSCWPNDRWVVQTVRKFCCCLPFESWLDSHTKRIEERYANSMNSSQLYLTIIHSINQFYDIIVLNLHIETKWLCTERTVLLQMIWDYMHKWNVKIIITLRDK